jgi:hypothetical protein
MNVSVQMFVVCGCADLNSPFYPSILLSFYPSIQNYQFAPLRQILRIPMRRIQPWIRWLAEVRLDVDYLEPCAVGANDSARG